MNYAKSLFRSLVPPPSLSSIRQLASWSRSRRSEPSFSVVNEFNINRVAPVDLRSIKDNEGARKKKVRVGRGRGSGCGKTCGRGMKGRKARGSVPVGFEGGQTPLHKRLPKRNTYDPFARKLNILSLGVIQRFIDLGRLPSSGTLTIRDFVRSGCVNQLRDGVILVGGGNFKAAVDIQVTECAPHAASTVLRAGGKITLAWYNKLGLRALTKPEKWTKRSMPLPRWARPPPKLEHRYPDRLQDGLPVRYVNTQHDIDAIAEAWKRVVHERTATLAL